MKCIFTCSCGFETENRDEFLKHNHKDQDFTTQLMYHKRTIAIPMLKIGEEFIECPRWIAELKDEERAKLSIDYKGENYYAISKVYNIDGSYYLRTYYNGTGL